MEFELTTDKTCGFSRIGDLVITVLMKDRYPDTTWDECVRIMGRVPVAEAAPASIVYAPYANVTSGQRRKAAEVAARYPPPRRAALVSNSALVRAAMHALHLVRAQRPYRAFKASDSRQALEWLREVAEFEVDAAERLMATVIAACSEDGHSGPR